MGWHLRCLCKAPSLDTHLWWPQFRLFARASLLPWTCTTYSSSPACPRCSQAFRACCPSSFMGGVSTALERPVSYDAHRRRLLCSAELCHAQDLLVGRDRQQRRQRRGHRRVHRRYVRRLGRARPSVRDRRCRCDGRGCCGPADALERLPDLHVAGPDAGAAGGAGRGRKRLPHDVPGLRAGLEPVDE